MKRKLFKSLFAVAAIAAVGLGSYKAYGSYVARPDSGEDLLLAENLLALSDQPDDGTKVYVDGKPCGICVRAVVDNITHCNDKSLVGHDECEVYQYHYDVGQKKQKYERGDLVSVDKLNGRREWKPSHQKCDHCLSAYTNTGSMMPTGMTTEYLHTAVANCLDF